MLRLTGPLTLAAQKADVFPLAPAGAPDEPAGAPPSARAAPGNASVAETSAASTAAFFFPNCFVMVLLLPLPCPSPGPPFAVRALCYAFIGRARLEL